MRTESPISSSAWPIVPPGAGIRPDFILFSNTPPRALLVEVKLTEREEYTPDRRGIVDALAYLHDAQEALQSFPAPRALVVAWNSDANPAAASVVVANQAGVSDAIARILGQWATPGTTVSP